MNHQLNRFDKLIKLDRFTPQGIVMVGSNGLLFLVLCNSSSRFAIQLTQVGPFPIYSAFDLEKEDLGMGVWLGSVNLIFGTKKVETYRGFAGSIVHYRDKAFFKTNSSYGSGENIHLPGLVRYAPRVCHYTDWRLTYRIGDTFCGAFTPPDQPQKMRPYDGPSTAQLPPQFSCL